METNSYEQMVRYVHGAIAVVLLVQACSIRSEHGEAEHQVNRVDTVQLDSSNFNFGIFNNRSEPISFTMQLDGTFPMRTDELHQHIIENGDLHVDTLKRTWEYVCDRTFHYNSQSTGNWVHDPYLQVNSTGGGLCDDRSSLLVSMWNALGYTGRVMGLGGHAVAEVYDGKRWLLFDPDHEVFYTDNEGRVLGIVELIERKGEGVNVQANEEIQRVIWDSERPGRHRVLDVYFTTEDNRDETEFSLGFNPFSDPVFRLPPNCSINFLRTGFTDDHWIACAELMPGVSGDLAVPFVPYAAIGKATLTVGDRMVELGGGLQALPQDKFHDRLHVVSVDSSTLVFYYINPKLFPSANKHIVELQGEIDELEVKPVGPKPLVIDRARYFGYLIDAHSNQFAPFFDSLAIDMFLKAPYDSYAHFLQQDSTLDNDARERLLSSFQTDLDAAIRSVGFDSEHWRSSVQKHFPQSAIILFLSLRYGMAEHMNLLFSSEGDHLQLLLPKHE